MKEVAALGVLIRNHAKQYKVASIAVVLPEALRTPTLFGQLSYAIEMASYQYHLKTTDLPFVLEAVTFLVADVAGIEDHQDYKFFRVGSRNKAIARDLGNGRANIVTVTEMINQAKQVHEAFPDTKLTIIQGEELLEHDMNLLYNVGKAAEVQPAMVSLEHRGNPDSEDFIAVVGKGLIYDNGGLNIKTRMMKAMFTDKCGACDVLAAFQGVLELGLKVNVVCALGVAENSISSNSYRPSDIITSKAGITIEVDNTDAEGRLAMASAMTWVQKAYPVKELIQYSTLTGGSMVALGFRTGALFSNNDQMIETFKDISKTVHEPVWHMPLLECALPPLKVPHADYQNMNSSYWASCPAAATFLKLFVEDGVQWTHFDIAGPSLARSPYGLYTQFGATGFGVLTIIEYLQRK